MAFPIRPFTEGMRPAPRTPDEQARYARSFEAHKISARAGDAVLRSGGSIEAANEAIQASYAAVMQGAPVFVAEG